jgi:hypothetical protein
MNITIENDLSGADETGVGTLDRLESSATFDGSDELDW